MGLILCMAADSASYLTIPELSVRVFSSEELCYCILKYPLLFLEDFLDDGVFRFLGTVTGDVRFKAELRDMKENGVKDEEIILRILEGSGYCSSAEAGQFRSRIQEAGMGESVVILGRKGNPYPYIRACDLYVQPSRYEGKCVSVLEAQILGKPVVIANYPTAQSQLEDGVDGVIVPQDNEGCAMGIARLLEDTVKMAALCKSCELNDYSGAGEAEKLYALVP